MDRDISNPESNPSAGIDLVRSRKWWFLISGLLISASLILLLIPPGLVRGIEFSSGTSMLLKFESAQVKQSELRQAFADLGHAEARIQGAGDREFLIKTDQLDIPEGSFSEVVPESNYQSSSLSEPAQRSPEGTLVTGESPDSVGTIFVRAALNDDPCDLYAVRAEVAVLTELRVFAKTNCPNGQNFEVLANGVMGWITEYSMHDFVPDPIGVAVSNEDNITDLGERTVINNYLQEQFGPFVTLEFSTVSPVVSSAAVRNATLAIAVATLFIMAYVRFAFSTVPKPSRYAVCAIIALIHDTVIVIGAFSLFGKLFGAEINLMFVTGILTAIGFSVHDSIVVFDRIRENITASPQRSLSENVNSALLQTMARSLNTSLTLLLPIGALLLLGGDTIQSFLLAILVGVVVGTYSSVAIAAQLLVAWEQGDLSRWFSRAPWSNKARA